MRRQTEQNVDDDDDNDETQIHGRYQHMRTCFEHMPTDSGIKYLDKNLKNICYNRI